MKNILLNLPLETIRDFYLTDFYSDFWKLANETGYSTKFLEDVKIISRHLLEQARQESNPIRRQYFVLALILFGELAESSTLMEQKFWSPQLRNNYKKFVTSEHFVHTFFTQNERAKLGKIAENAAFSASLYDKYSDLINEYSQAAFNEEDFQRVSSEDYKIWFCWLQGEENLPPIVRCCYNSLKENAGHYKVVFIDEKNFSNYVDIAPHVMDKFRAGKISRTHFSDILRVNLLERHGGLWLDASFLVTEPLENHKDLLEKPYFTQSFCKEKSYTARFVGHITFGRWMAGIQGTTLLHAPLYKFIKDFFNEYLLSHDSFEIYFLFDFAISLAYDNILSVKKGFDDMPINNTDVWGIHGHLNDFYEEYPFDKLLKNTFLYNVSWKIKINQTKPATVFREIQRRYAPEMIT